MATKNKTTRQPAPTLEETLDPEELLWYFRDHAGTFQTFKTLQGMFNDHVARGALESYTQESLRDFMYHFTLISEIIYKLETLAANRLINKLKAGKESPEKRKERLLRQAEQIIKAQAKKKAG